MIEKSKTTAIKFELAVSTVLILLIDWFLFNRLTNIAGDLEFYFFVSIAVFFNAFYIINLILRIKSKDNDDITIKSLLGVLRNIEYATPIERDIAKNHDKKDVDELTYQKATLSEQKPKNEIIEPMSYDDIPKPKHVIKQEPVYDLTIEPSVYCDHLAQYLYDFGIFIEKNNSREIFASMASSKLTILKNHSPFVSQRFLELFSDYIGAHLYFDEHKEHTHINDDLLLNNEVLRECILHADKEKHQIHIMAFQQLDMKDFEIYGKKIIEFSLNPLLPCSINYSKLSHVQEMPNNIWFVLIPSPNENDYLSKTIYQSAVSIELSPKIIQPKDEVYLNQLKLTVESFNNLLIDGYEAYYLDEPIWKNFDELESFYEDSKTFTIDNKLFRQLERYVSTFLMFGGEKNEAIDHVLFSKLLQVIATINLDSKNENKEDIMILFDKLFGLENLIKSKKIIKDIHAKYQNNDVNEEIEAL